MLTKGKKTVFLIAVMLACVPVSWAAPQKQKENLQATLARPADFVPTDKSTLNRLVSIAQHYEIPMGIEWFEGTEDLELPAPAIPAKATVRDLLTAIVSRLTDYVLTIERGVVHIAPPVIAVRKDNVLNLIIEHFEVNNDDLFGAQFNLRVAIFLTLHPEYQGFAGGYGTDPEHVFTKRLFSYQSDHRTVRQILDGLIKANGNALWITEFDRKDFTPPERPEHQWRFVPLKEKLTPPPTSREQ